MYAKENKVIKGAVPNPLKQFKQMQERINNNNLVAYYNHFNIVICKIVALCKKKKKRKGNLFLVFLRLRRVVIGTGTFFFFFLVVQVLLGVSQHKILWVFIQFIYKNDVNKRREENDK